MLRPDFTHLPNGRAGQLLALAVLIAGVATFVLLIALPAFALWQELDNELRLLQQQADGYSRLIGHQSEVRKTLLARRAEMAASADYLTAADPAIAAAQVQRDLSARAETSGVSVRTTLTLPPAAADNFVSVGFQLSVSGSLASLREFLYSIESGQPRLIVDHMLLTSEHDAGTATTHSFYDMTLDLHGYMQKAEARQ